MDLQIFVHNFCFKANCKNEQKVLSQKIQCSGILSPSEDNEEAVEPTCHVEYSGNWEVVNKWLNIKLKITKKLYELYFLYIVHTYFFQFLCVLKLCNINSCFKFKENFFAFSVVVDCLSSGTTY